MAKNLLGRLDARAFGPLELPRLEARVLDGFRALGDLTGTTSDAMDECRSVGALPGSALRPTDPKARLVGQAITVLNQRREATSMQKSGLGEIDHSRKIGYPIWRSSVSPVTGKWRIQTVAINRPVSIAGIPVRADEVGVCSVPFDRAVEVPLKDWIKL